MDHILVDRAGWLLGNSDLLEYAGGMTRRVCTIPAQVNIPLYDAAQAIVKPTFWLRSPQIICTPDATRLIWKIAVGCYVTPRSGQLKAIYPAVRHMGGILDYRTPTPSEPHLNWPTVVVGGVITGAFTMSSVLVLGYILYLGVGVLAGVVLSAIAARASRGYEFRAGFIASAFAAAAAVGSALILSPWLGGSNFLADPGALVIVFVFWWALFALPGMLGSLWFWEGRRPREWDKHSPPE